MRNVAHEKWRMAGKQMDHGVHAVRQDVREAPNQLQVAAESAVLLTHVVKRAKKRTPCRLLNHKLLIDGMNKWLIARLVSTPLFPFPTAPPLRPSTPPFPSTTQTATPPL